MKSISQFFMTALLVSTAIPSLSHASAMTKERARCWAYQMDGEKYKKWSAELDKFQAEAHQLNKMTRLEVGLAAMRSGTSRLNDLQKASGIRSYSSLIRQAEALIQEAERGHRPVLSANKIISSALRNIDDATNDTLSRIQTKNPNCSILPETIRAQSSQISESVR